MKKFLELLTFTLLFIWQLPQNIIGIFFLLYFWLRKDLELISYKKMCWAFKSKYMSGGISLGNFAFINRHTAKIEAVVKHEQEGHTLDSKIYGPLYLIVIGLPSILWAAFKPEEICYYSFYTERLANKHANLEVIVLPNGQCVLRVKE